MESTYNVGPMIEIREQFERRTGFSVRAVCFWALLFSGEFLLRTLLDWRVPVNDFLLRSQISTYAAATTLLLAAFMAAWRTKSFIAGPIMTLAVSLFSALFSAIGSALLFALWHDPATLQAIAGSGGLEEVFVLPFLIVIPAAILGIAGGVAGTTCHRLLRVKSAGA